MQTYVYKSEIFLSVVQEAEHHHRITIKEKVQNLKSLLTSQLDLATTAEMSDLEMAIREGKGKTSTTPQITFQEVGNKIKIGEYIVGIFMDGFYPG